MIPVILSGGVGSRLWPLSRGLYPKQLLPLVDETKTMLQQTLMRVGGESGSPIIVCNEEHRFMVGEQVHQAGIRDASIILEPEGRNTAPAIALAAIIAFQQDENATLLVMPADHVVEDSGAFQLAVKQAEALALQDKLVTFGIVPDSPETGYGYIKAGSSLGNVGFKVSEFKEKPNAQLARQYVDSGDYYWNAGIFVFKASVYLSELDELAPNVATQAREAIGGSRADLDFLRLDEAAFLKSPNISIDYAVMEKTDRAAVVPLNVGWSDVGSWSALWEVSPKDTDGNALVGDVIAHETFNTHVYSESKLVSTVGVENLIVVETADAVMVANKERSQEVKEIVKQLKSEKRSLVTHHRKVYRPWGWYDSIDAGDRFQVKRIQVKPGAKLSVQMHYHRAEHWVVVRGTAEVLNGEETTLLKENESTYIPIGVTHALRNPSETQVLEIIEVQSGSYLGEDDIVRFEDNYGRAGTDK